MAMLRNFFLWLTGRTEIAPSVASLKGIKEQSRINYSATLVPELKGDHVELLQMYTGVAELLKQARYHEIAASLVAFKAKLDMHLLHENLRFYCYLEEQLIGSPDDVATVRDFRVEMNAIARGVVNFVRQYQTSGVTFANHKTFETDFQKVGALLVSRIEREEQHLYILYRPHL